MQNKKKFPISLLFSISYTAITVIFLAVFVTVVFLISQKLFVDFNQKQLAAYFATQEQVTDQTFLKTNNYNGYRHVVFKKEGYEFKRIEIALDEMQRTNEDNSLKEAYQDFENRIKTLAHKTKYSSLEVGESTLREFNKFDVNKHKYLAYYQLKRTAINIAELKIAITDEKFIDENKKKFTLSFISIFAFVLIVTNFISYILVKVLITKRINSLSIDIKELPSHKYQKPIKIQGRDEITEISENIDELRKEILIQEIGKRAMLQNMSHDIKNPIGIIKSYGEAIQDGIASTDDIKIILQKTDELSNKVSQLINYVKAEYLSSEKPNYKEFLVKPIIEKLVEENKYRFKGEFELQLDNSKYMGLKNKFSIAIENLIENSIRYAKEKIKITLSKRILKIENDGPPIDEEFLSSMFQLYHKSSKGQFGIGLSITKSTLLNFGLDIKASNKEEGVVFKIFPL